jgi:hypothetical protein
MLGNEQPKIDSSLEWNLAIKEAPNGWRPRNQTLNSVSEKSWINRIRKVPSDKVFSRFGPNPIDVEQEQFLYYDGVFPQGNWMKILVDKEDVSLTSQVTHPLFDITIVDRRTANPRVARIEKLEAKQRIDKVTFAKVDETKFTAEASATLLKQLTQAGLFEAEAQSLVDLWKKEMFETPGLNLYYRLPQEEYNKRLPLTITPKPAETVRVGLVYHAHLEPDFEARIIELVNKLDAPRFVDRDAAMRDLVNLGPAALVQLQRIRNKDDLSVEVRQRVETLIRKWSAKDGFGDLKTTPR